MSGDSLNQQIDGGAGESGGSGGQEEKDKNKHKNPIGHGRKAKRVVLSKIKKAKKRLLQRNKSKGKGESVSRSSGSSNSCCCLYIRRIPSMDSSSSESPTSDPNCSEFGFDSLRGLIEKSDFLLNECNTHLDVYSADDLHDDDD